MQFARALRGIYERQTFFENSEQARVEHALIAEVETREELLEAWQQAF